MGFFQKYHKYKNKNNLLEFSGGRENVTTVKAENHLGVKRNETSKTQLDLSLSQKSQTLTTMQDQRINLGKEMIPSIVDQFKYEVDNHIHHLDGFYDTVSQQYFYLKNIEITQKSSNESFIIVDDNSDSKGNFIHIKKIVVDYLKSMLSKHALARLSKINSNNIDVDDFIKNTEKYLVKVTFHKPQNKTIRGGEIEDIPLSLEPPRQIKYKCDPHGITGWVPMYGEPVIKTIQNLLFNTIMDNYHHIFDNAIILRNIPPLNPLIIAMGGFNEVLRQHSSTILQNIMEHPPYNALIDYDFIYTDIMNTITNDPGLKFCRIILAYVNFDVNMIKRNSFTIPILRHHILNNKYAHNGIDKDNFDILQSISALIESNLDNLVTLQFIHSYLHIYDALFMYKEGSVDYQDGLGTLQQIRSYLHDIVHRECIENYVNTNRYDFINRSIDPKALHNSHLTKYALDYDITTGALTNKIRQYGQDLDDDSLYPNYEQTLRGYKTTNDHVHNITGETELIPSGIERNRMKNLNKQKCLILRRHLQNKDFNFERSELTPDIIRDTIVEMNVEINTYDPDTKNLRLFNGEEDFIDCINWLRNPSSMTGL